MKSIIYLSDLGDRPCRPIVVDHDPRFPALEHFKHHDPRYLKQCYPLYYVCTIEASMGAHEKINRRAEHIGRTGSRRQFHGRAIPESWGKNRIYVGRDCQWHVTPERIAKSRFRNAKRRVKTKTFNHLSGYCPIDISFGLLRGLADHDHFTPSERSHILARLEIASTLRTPLPPWRLVDCYSEAA